MEARAALVSGPDICDICNMRYFMVYFALTGPVLAEQTPLTATQFEALVEGKTMSYSTGGVEYGAEVYYSNRRVLWSFLGDECFEGYWYPSDTLICFAYEGLPQDQCWHFYSEGNGVFARFWDQSANDIPYQISPRAEPLSCPGPKVGA